MRWCRQREYGDREFALSEVVGFYWTTLQTDL
jgi:hypothetical protein